MMQGFLLVLSSAALISGYALADADVPLKQITLDQAVKDTVEAHPSIRVYEARKEEADAKRSAVISSVFPNVSGFLRASERKDAFTSQSLLFGGEKYNFYETGLQLTQPVFQGGAFSGGLDFYSKSEELQDQNLLAAKNRLSQQAIEAFYDVLVVQKQIETLERTIKIQEDLLAKTQKKARVGTGTQLDALQFKTHVALLRPQLTEANVRLLKSATVLASLIGLKEKVRVQVVGRLDVPEVEHLFRKYKSSSYSNPELKAAELTVELAQAKKKVDMAKHWPKVNLYADWGRNATVKSELTDENRTSWSMGIQLTVPIFTGLSSVHDRRAAAAAESEALAQQDRLRVDTEVELVRTDEDLKVGLSLVRSSMDALRLAEQTAREARRTFGFRTITFMQYSEAQKDLLDAEFRYESSRKNYITSLVRYFVARAWPLTELVKTLGEFDGKTETKEVKK